MLLEVRQITEPGLSKGWVYVLIPAEVGQQLNPNVRKAYRVDATINGVLFKQIAFNPAGEGKFMLVLNAVIRKKAQIVLGQNVECSFTLADAELPQDPDFMEALQEEPFAHSFFNKQSLGHKNYYAKWISEAKSLETKAKRIEQCLFGLKNGMNFPETLRYFKKVNHWW